MGSRDNYGYYRVLELIRALVVEVSGRPQAMVVLVLEEELVRG